MGSFKRVSSRSKETGIVDEGMGLTKAQYLDVWKLSSGFIRRNARYLPLIAVPKYHRKFTENWKAYRKELTERTYFDKWNVHEQSAIKSVRQAALNYGAIALISAYLLRRGIDPRVIPGLREGDYFKLTAAHQALTLAVFGSEYAAVRLQQKAGIIPHSPQGLVPLAAVVAGKKGAQYATGVSVLADLAKNISPGHSGFSLVMKSAPGLLTRSAFAAGNISRAALSLAKKRKISRN